MHLFLCYPVEQVINLVLDLSLRGLTRVKMHCVKKAITPEILLQISSVLNFGDVNDKVFWCVFLFAFLAHLSRWLIGELIVYPCSGVRRRRCRPPFSKISSETDWPIKAKFYVEPPWEGGTKVYMNRSGHMAKMAAMPIYGINLKNLLLQNRKSYDLEIWHVVLWTQALQSLYKC